MAELLTFDEMVADLIKSPGLAPIAEGAVESVRVAATLWDGEGDIRPALLGAYIEGWTAGVKAALP